MFLQTNFPANLHELDSQQFGNLIAPYGRELRAHCYRMLGSVIEAEEIVQETFLRAWLYKIATNLCIDTQRQKPRRALPITREPASTLEQPIPDSIYEPIWLEPYPADIPAPEETNPEARYSMVESIKLAFLALLHLLPPFQRAVLILRDVLGWPASEVADVLGQTIPSVKSALYRARITMARYQQTHQIETVITQISDESMSKLLESYVQAWEAADVEGLVAILREDCTFSMPPIPSWYQGRVEIGLLVSKTVFRGQARGRWRLLPTVANAQPGFGLYKLNESSGNYDGYGIQVITFAGNEIIDITTFQNPALIEIFGLPPFG